MAIGYIGKDGLLHVYTHWHAIAPPRKLGKSGSGYWALSTFGVLSEEEWKEYPVNAFSFRQEMRPAIERILTKKKQSLRLTTEAECLQRTKDAIEGKYKGTRERFDE